MWYKRVETVLLDSGYKKSEHELCVSFKSKKEYITIITLYVDDFFIFEPDISYSVSFLSQFNMRYNESHWKCAKRILRYL